jgi:hypothetical protein
VVTEKMSDLRGHIAREMYTFFASRANPYVKIKVGYVKIGKVDRCVKIYGGDVLLVPSERARARLIYTPVRVACERRNPHTAHEQRLHVDASNFVSNAFKYESR